MKAKVLTILIIILAVLTAIFSWLFYIRVGMNYNSEGNYFDKDSLVIYNEQSQIVYGLIAFISFILTLFICLKLKSIIKK